MPTMPDKKEILYVDDEMDMSMIMKDILEISGYSVTVASDGKQALDSMAKKIFDLVILDLMLGELSITDC